MGKFNLLISLALPIPFLVFSLIQCEGTEGKREIKEFYLAPNFNSYKIETVALLPMAYDNTTSIGTFYSTNYFYNKLLESDRYNLVDIDKISSSDSSTIAAQLISIRDSQRIVLDSFYITPLGKFLKSQNCDAIIIGNVVDYSNYYFTDTQIGLFSTLNLVNVTNFNYFMVSLQDGSVLWAANLEGKTINKERLRTYNNTDYPPIDYSISYGIDALLEKLEKEFILHKK